MDGTGLPNPSRETKFSDANADRETFIFPVQLTTCRIGNLTRLIHTTLAICVTIQHSTIGGRRVCTKIVPVLGGDGTKIAPPGDLFDQPPGEMNCIQGKLADYSGDHAVLSPEGVVLAPSPGTESSYPRPPQSLYIQ